MSRLLARTRVWNFFFFAYETIGKLQSFVLNFSEIVHFPRAVRVTNSCYWYTVLHFIALETRKITALVQRNCITESLQKTKMWKSPRKILSKTTKWWDVGMDITFNVNLTLLRISFVAYFNNNYFGKSWLMAIGVITICKYWQVLFASEQQKRQSHASSV